jgi:large subunit ribosomal protein L19
VSFIPLVVTSSYSDIESYMAMPEEEDVTTKGINDTQSEDTKVEETSEDVKVEELEVKTDTTSETPTEGPEVESVEDKEEKSLDEPGAVEEVAETEDYPAPIEMDPESAAHLSMQTKIVQATYGDIRKDLPHFHSGDTISVGYRVIEGSRSRVQIFEGLVIKISAGHGLDKTFTVRKISGGIGVERIFPFHSPNIESVKVLKEGKVRRAKLYYLRGLKGKATRIKERIK